MENIQNRIGLKAKRPVDWRRRVMVADPSIADKRRTSVKKGEKR